MSAADTDRDGPEDGDDLLAGEYVLGVQDAALRREVEARMSRDRAFAERVERWQADMASFDGAYQPEAPPAHVYARVEARLFAETRHERPGMAARLWGSLGLWRGLALASLLAVAALGSLVLTNEIGRVEPEMLVAEMSAPDSPFDLVAHYDGTTGAMRISAVATEPAERQSLEVWLIEGPDAAPISLGVFEAESDGTMVVDSAMRDRITEGAVLAVSLEPEGGSPTGQPTGPVVASGTASRP
jgi:anti-sigma-K factor RskA